MLACFLLVVVGLAVSAAIMVVLVRSGKPVRGLLSSAIQGLAALVVVNITGAFTGVSLGLGPFSGGVAAVLGIPGVISMVLVKTMLR